MEMMTSDKPTEIQEEKVCYKCMLNIEQKEPQDKHIEDNGFPNGGMVTPKFISPASSRRESKVEKE